MTFSLCVREPYEDDRGDTHTRYGVVVTTRLPAVGKLCPFANEHGAIATQSRVNVELGRKGLELLGYGLGIDDALSALLNADDGRAERQLHGVDADGTFVHSGGECKDWYGHLAGDRYTVAGNLLAGEAVITAVAETYETNRSGDALLAERLIDALAAGQAEGGDKRTERPVQSAALVVATTAGRDSEPFYNDLRVDASEAPIDDFRQTLQLARDAWADRLARQAARAEE